MAKQNGHAAVKDLNLLNRDSDVVFVGQWPGEASRYTIASMELMATTFFVTDKLFNEVIRDFRNFLDNLADEARFHWLLIRA